MSNATADKAASGVQPRRDHAGRNVVRAIYKATASHSATDVIQGVKVPNRAVIDEVTLVPIDATNVGGSTPAALTITIGDGVDPSRYFSGSYSATVVVRATGGLGYQYSISDDAAVMYDTIDVTITAGALTASQGFVMIVAYHNEEP